MSRLFDPALVYPSDEYGNYVELEGTVVFLGEPLFDERSVKVRTLKGTFTGYATTRFVRDLGLGYQARIRVYRFYPDHRIVGWSAPFVTWPV